MKLPRDLSGLQLAKRLESYGYNVVRQTGSHMRLVSTKQEREHKITIPNHSPIKVGTLASIIADLKSICPTASTWRWFAARLCTG